MGLRYRKSFKAGPFRATISKSGVSYSAGVKGARVTKLASGKVQKTVSVPGSGLSYTSTSGSKAEKGQPGATPTPANVGAYSTTPAMPPHWAPGRFKGYLASVTLTQTSIVIERTFMGRLNGNISTEISWRDVMAVDFREPTASRNGYIHFVVPGDPRQLTATGNGNRVAATARQPHAVMFTWQQRKRYQQLKGILAGTTTR